MYKQGDKVLLNIAQMTKFNHDAYLGAYVIIAARNNSTVRDHKARIMDTRNKLQSIMGLMTYKAVGLAKYNQYIAK